MSDWVASLIEQAASGPPAAPASIAQAAPPKAQATAPETFVDAKALNNKSAHQPSPVPKKAATQAPAQHVVDADALYAAPPFWAREASAPHPSEASRH